MMPPTAWQARRRRSRSVRPLGLVQVNFGHMGKFKDDPDPLKEKNPAQVRGRAWKMWYDYERGYSCRSVDLSEKVARRAPTSRFAATAILTS